MKMDEPFMWFLDGGTGVYVCKRTQNFDPFSATSMRIAVAGDFFVIARPDPQEACDSSDYRTPTLR